ncbi:hypothetical protein IWW37_005739 [Coemansia sp. RSA 2050]|nr:hypothetical protein IWW37_005739 [Coemansia sp. RSA 2050]
MCFPLVNKLTVKIANFEDKRFDSINIANVLEFAQDLKSMVPVAATVKLVCEGHADSDVDSDFDSDSNPIGA